MFLAPSGSKCPKLTLWIKQKDAVLPADACRHHVAYTLAAACGRNKQDVLRSIMQHDLVIEGVPANDKAGFFGRKTGFLNI